jgi:hypothetical protein
MLVTDNAVPVRSMVVTHGIGGSMANGASKSP